MSKNLMETPSNLDFRGNMRGKCKDPTCDCEEYLKTENNACGMCGCFPGKHELMADGACTQKLTAAISTAMKQLSTPSKVAELDLESGEVIVHSKDGRKSVKRPLDFDPEQKSASNDVVVSADDESNASKSSVTLNDDEDEPMSVNVGNTEETPKVEISRNKPGTSGFSSTDIHADFISYDLKSKIEKTGLLPNETLFLGEAASYLVSLAGTDKPSVSQQNIFCETVVGFYPALRTEVGKCKLAAFKSALSKHLTNRRYRLKHASSSVPSKVKSCALVKSVDENMEVSAGDLQEMLAKLKAVTSTSPDGEVLLLIKCTSTARRVSTATEDSDKTPKQISELWPHLSNPDWLIYDFFSIQNLDEEKFQSRISSFLRCLAKMFEMPEEERSFVDCLSLMAQKLSKNQPKKVKPVVMLVEPLGSLAALKPQKVEAPRLIFNVGDDSIEQCFLLVDDMRMELQTPTAKRAIALLMAAYYIFDIKYPPAYANFMNVLDAQCAGKKEAIKPSQRTLFKFYRSLVCVDNMPVDNVPAKD